MPKIDAQGRATDATLPDGEQEFRATEASPVEAQPVDEPKEAAPEQDEKPKQRTTRK